MIRSLIGIGIALFAFGCQTQGTAPRVRITPDQARQLDLTQIGAVAADRSGGLYVATPATLMRYDGRAHRLEDLLNDPCRDLRDVAVTGEGVVLVLRPRALAAYTAGYLVEVRDLPAEGLALSCDRQFAYILLARDSGASLVRYHLTGPAKGQFERLLTTEDRPRALCAVRGGCLVASGGNLVKVTDPVEGQVTTVLLVAIQEPILSVAADPDKRIVYFADADMTYAWIQGQVVHVLPAGNRLAWAQDTLTICQSGASGAQVIQIPSASRHTTQLLKSLKPGTP